MVSLRAQAWSSTGAPVRRLNMYRVFEHVLTTVAEGSKYKNICIMIRYALGFAWCSCEVERFGRIMNLTKTSSRINLGDDTFPALCFIKHAMPGFAAIDYDRLVAAWYEEGHVSARSIARGAEDSVVMQRLALQDRKRSHTPIGTTRTSWA